MSTSFIYFDNCHIGVVVADIVGKGIPAGLFMAMLKSIVHTYCVTYQFPQDILKSFSEVRRMV